MGAFNDPPPPTSPGWQNTPATAGLSMASLISDGLRTNVLAKLITI